MASTFNNEKRGCIVKVRVTETERRDIQTRAGGDGKVSQWIRRKILPRRAVVATKF